MDSSIRQPCPRTTERRASRAALVLRERRTGFDRRGAVGTLSAGLLELRDSPPGLLVLLASVNVMNLLDQLATTRALSAGFAEGNPVMAALIATDPRLAAAVKVGAVLAVTSAVWTLRRYRAILQAAIFMFILYAAVLLVHFYGAAFCY